MSTSAAAAAVASPPAVTFEQALQSIIRSIITPAALPAELTAWMRMMDFHSNYGSLFIDVRGQFTIDARGDHAHTCMHACTCDMSTDPSPDLSLVVMYT